jgi:hypothetical protein
MADNKRNEVPVAPVVAGTPTVGFSSLRRFADAPGCSQNIEEASTTICGEVLQAAHREIERINQATRLLRADLKPRVEAMLGVISYCYTKGLFDSEEIERRLWEDDAFLATFSNEIPSAQRIRNFRRNHRENILAIIEQALQQYGQRTSSPSGPVSHDTSEAVCESVRLKAQQLLDMANIMDQLGAD